MLVKSPLAKRSQFLEFPIDEYVPASIISYQVASLPPSKLARDKNPIPSVRFLFAGFTQVQATDELGNYLTNEDGTPIMKPAVVRKWTSWITISYGERSRMRKIFRDPALGNIEALLTSDGEGGKLWTTPYRIMLELSADGKYRNITAVKLGDDTSVLAINYTGKSKLPDGTETFAPYKQVSAYGRLVYLELAVNKEDGHIKTYTGEELIDNPEENS